MIFAPKWWTALTDFTSGILRGSMQTLCDQLNLKGCDNNLNRFSASMLLYVDRTEILEKEITISVNSKIC